MTFREWWEKTVGDAPCSEAVKSSCEAAFTDAQSELLDVIEYVVTTWAHPKTSAGWFCSYGSTMDRCIKVLVESGRWELQNVNAESFFLARPVRREV